MSRRVLVCLTSLYFEPILLARGIVTPSEYDELCSEIGAYRSHIENLNCGDRSVASAYESVSNMRKPGIHLDQEFPYELNVVDEITRELDYSIDDELLETSLLDDLKSQSVNRAWTNAFFTHKADSKYGLKIQRPGQLINSQVFIDYIGKLTHPQIRSLGTVISPILSQLLN